MFFRKISLSVTAYAVPPLPWGEAWVKRYAIVIDRRIGFGWRLFTRVVVSADPYRGKGYADEISQTVGRGRKSEK